MATQTDHSYYVAGGRVGVLLIHGLAGTPAEMRYVANGMARAGYTVYCPQLAGHCGSAADIKRTTWQDWYRSAEQALLELRRECDTVIVGGLSTGAVLALLLAARHPEAVHERIAEYLVERSRRMAIAQYVARLASRAQLSGVDLPTPASLRVN